jgi:GNAT superfamily N-acetyltransferase
MPPDLPEATGATPIVRLARVDEAPMLSDLALHLKGYWGYNAAFLEHCRPFLQMLPEDIAAGYFYVVEADGVVEGFYSWRPNDEDADLADLFVDPAAIGRGLGKRLWEHAATLTRGMGFRSLIVQSDPNAEGFYFAMGATRIGESLSEVFEGRMLPLLRIELR